MSEPRPFLWSVRREVWENRSIYIAPVVVTSFVMFGFLISMFTLGKRMRSAGALDPAKQREVVTMPFNAIAGLVMMTGLLVAVFYCLDALYGERRDRSILFWKSLPVSDRTTILSKAAIPLAVIPLVSYAMIVAVQIVMLFLSSIVLMGSRQGLATFWSNMHFFQELFVMFYGLVAINLWLAPVYAWLLLVSAWARRTPFLWAFLPFFAVMAFEAAAFRTSHFAKLVAYRVFGWYTTAFTWPPKGSKVAVDPLDHITPGRFLTTPGLWIGLLFAVLLLAAVIRMRRYREPI
jgi:ABC-2 type transport system permease protein